MINKTVYLVLAINLEGQKEWLGLWLADTEGAKFWLSVLTELHNRGGQDIFIAGVDGLTGFPEAIRTAFPNTKVQLCIVHLVRNALKYVAYKDYKAVTRDLKTIYRAATLAEAERALEAFAERWDEKYPSISALWRRHWENWITLFDYPEDIRRAIYTTNAIELVNSVIRKAIKQRRIFPSDRSVMKVIYRAMEQAAQKWTMPIQDWKRALNRFAIEFEDRFPSTLN